MASVALGNLLGLLGPGQRVQSCLVTLPEDTDHASREERRNPHATPFLRWPGGKRWFVDSYAEVLPRDYNLYIEPFLGAGSVFFYLQPRLALLGDSNPDVVTAFVGVKDDPYGVQQLLAAHHIEHSKEHYYRVRDNRIPETLAAQAARIIYLNRTCFNGIYRVNRQGAFNVPMGGKTKVSLDTDNFPLAARLLSRTQIVLSDFESLIEKAQEGDFVFLDPPYTVRHNRNGFIKYNEKLFSWEDQERLARAATRAAQRGAKVIVTNAAHDSIRDLYRSDVFRFMTVRRFSSIAASSVSRKQFEELVIVAP